MASPCPQLKNGSRLVVGSAASAADLLAATPGELPICCDLVEVRLDLLEAAATGPWRHLSSIPLLFTARRPEEGGAGDLSAGRRLNLLSEVLNEASVIDIEVASIAEMAPLLAELKQRQLPWVASFHDFEKLPEASVLEKACSQAREAGAMVFKLAAKLPDEAALERLVEFQRADHGLATATMGMGPLAAESRLRCAQAGSTLNYGYLGETPTAPGQWSAAKLKQAIGQLADLTEN